MNNNRCYRSMLGCYSPHILVLDTFRLCPDDVQEVCVLLVNYVTSSYMKYGKRYILPVTLFLSLKIVCHVSMID